MTPNPEQSERLLALAAQCEEADPAAPNIDLHMEILRALGWTSRGAELIDPQGQRCMQTPDPLHSIDGAVALVDDNFWRVEDHELAGPCALVGGHEGYARTPALALCAAALRARAGDGA